MYFNGVGVYCLGYLNIMKVYGPMWVHAMVPLQGGGGVYNV